MLWRSEVIDSYALFFTPHSAADIATAALAYVTRATPPAPPMFPRRFATPSPTQAPSCSEAMPQTQQQQHSRWLCTVANSNTTKLQKNITTSYFQIHPDSLMCPTDPVKRLGMHFNGVLDCISCNCLNLMCLLCTSDRSDV